MLLFPYLPALLTMMRHTAVCVVSVCVLLSLACPISCNSLSRPSTAVSALVLPSSAARAASSASSILFFLILCHTHNPNRKNVIERPPTTQPRMMARTFPAWGSSWLSRAARGLLLVMSVQACRRQELLRVRVTLVLCLP